MTALFLAQHEEKNKESPGDPFFDVIGYRDYVTHADLQGADENAQALHHLLLALKAGDVHAITFFSRLLEIVFDHVLGKVDLITCVPGHDKTPATRTDPLACLVEHVAGRRACLDGKSILQRKVALLRAHQDPRSRDFTRQVNSIKAGPLACRLDVRRILIIDDIYTSGKTMAACYSHLRRRWPTAQFIGFAFGRTNRTSTVGWPRIPVFPKSGDLPSKLASVVAELQALADTNRDFSRAKCVVLGLWNHKIHKLTCKYCPDRYQVLESVSEGKCQGGVCCRVCRPRDADF
jgi:predicted amidophosphoribosyltransferase